MKINVALVLRLDETVTEGFNNIQELMKRVEVLESELEQKGETVEDKYSLLVQLELCDNDYIINDYNINNIYKLEDIEMFSTIETLEEMFNEIENKDEIPFLNEIFENDWDILEDYFESKEQAVLSVIMGNYLYNDKYVYFNGYGNLVSCNYIPYEDYEIEIFNQWIDENL